MVDKDTTKEIAKLAVLELDLEVTKEISEVKTEVVGMRGEVRALEAKIPMLIAKEIRSCQQHQEKRRRWSIGTLLTIIGIGGSFGVGIAALFGG
jgi:hypothetical protein